jgi:hypothetical protein
MNKFITKHKRLLIIVLIALIIIGVAYYFTLGKDLFQNKDTWEGTDSGSGSNSTSPSTGSNSTGSLSFPLKWGIKNSYITILQKRLNLTITTCKTGSTISEDGILGSQTLTAIQGSFPNIAASVATNRSVSKIEYDIMINSKPGC